MKIIYITTISDNKNIGIVKENYFYLKSFFEKVILITNKDLHIENSIIFNESQENISLINAILSKAYEFDEYIYMLMDSKINLTELTLDDFMSIDKCDNDFLLLPYKSYSFIPSFFSLASSLNDFFNFKKKLFSENSILSKNDLEWNKPSYQLPNKNVCGEIKNILFGESFGRNNNRFEKRAGNFDFIMNGAIICKNKGTLRTRNFKLELDKNLLSWIDSYQLFLIKSGYSYTNAPFFIEYKNNKNSSKLSWDAVVEYIIKFNLYMKSCKAGWNENLIKLHTAELFYYVKGIIKKIELLDLSKEEKNIITIIKNFMNIDIKDIIKRS